MLPRQGASQLGYGGLILTKETGTTSTSAADWWKKEFNNRKCDDLFAGTPPVEAMRARVSMAASGTNPKNTDDCGRESCVHVRQMQEGNERGYVPRST